MSPVYWQWWAQCGQLTIAGSMISDLNSANYVRTLYNIQCTVYIV